MDSGAMVVTQRLQHVIRRAVIYGMMGNRQDKWRQMALLGTRIADLRDGAHHIIGWVVPQHWALD